MKKKHTRWIALTPSARWYEGQSYNFSVWMQISRFYKHGQIDTAARNVSQQ